MPRDPFKPLTIDEQRLVIHYLREGATPEVLPIAERKARLKKGEGASILRRRHVQEEIGRRQRLVEYEENKLIAKDKVAVAQRDDERDLVTLHKIEAALDKVIALDAKDHGQVVLKAIELGLIYTGSIRDGNKVKISTIDPLGQDKPKEDEPTDTPNKEDGFYRSIFANMKGETSVVPAQSEPAPLMPADDKPKPPPTVPVPPQAPKAAPAPKPPAPKPKKQEAPEIEIT